MQVNKKKRIKVFLLAAIAVISLGVLISLYPDIRLRNLAGKGQAAFEQEVLPEYLAYLQEESGYSDLSANIYILQDKEKYRRYYDKDTKTLTLSYVIGRFYSDEIDEDYTDELGSEKANHLKDNLRELAISQAYVDTSKSWAEYVYEGNGGQKLKLQMYDYDYVPRVEIRSGADHLYQYDLGGDYIEVDIDDEVVYFWQARKPSGSTGKNSSSQNSIGSGTGSSRYSSSGNKKNTFGNGNDGSDSIKTVDGYDDPDDYAADYKDSYDDYDDAYDAWEDEEGD